jgi:hypothetical protein
MGYLQLRILFELLCDGLEGEQNHIPLHFEGAYGLELPEYVLMVFVFQEGLIVCRFAVEDSYDKPRALFSRKKGISANDCIEMTDQLRSFSGNMTELFA